MDPTVHGASARPLLKAAVKAIKPTREESLDSREREVKRLLRGDGLCFAVDSNLEDVLGASADPLAP